MPLLNNNPHYTRLAPINWCPFWYFFLFLSIQITSSKLLLDHTLRYQFSTRLVRALHFTITIAITTAIITTTTIITATKIITTITIKLIFDNRSAAVAAATATATATAATTTTTATSGEKKKKVNEYCSSVIISNKSFIEDASVSFFFINLSIN